MGLNETRHDKLRRLASRTCAGEVVFFIGAGFSLDSEGNSAKLLIARLLARFEALADWMIDHGDADAKDAATRLKRGLRVTFSLIDPATKAAYGHLFDNQPRSGTQPSVLSEILTSLSQNYYLINDWMCSAFDRLVEEFPDDPATDLAAPVNARERTLLQNYESSATIAPIDLPWLRTLREAVKKKPIVPPERYVCGKALFLDTLGFNDDTVMAGLPRNAVLDEVARAVGPRVRTRHRVLAWLAAEGLCPTIVTTNYDLLLDSAHRLAGMLPLNPESKLWCDPQTPLDQALALRLPINRRYRHFSRIAQASQFFTAGDPHESATIHKIHGCVEIYRVARLVGDVDRFRNALKTIVFTFREIQNWRTDSWSRDHLTTLLRTHTIVFAGYGVVDQVIHDTFRTVYEEISRYRDDPDADSKLSASTAAATAPPLPAPQTPAPETHAPASPALPPDPVGSRARAFFTDVDSVRSFHILEILRAASQAAGELSTELADHANLLTFFTRGAEKPQFPLLDDLFAWVYHLVARELQAQALASEIRGIAYQLFRRRKPEEESDRILKMFRELREGEDREARSFDAGIDPVQETDVRRRFERLTRWTTVFHVALMREFQLAELLLCHPTEALAIRDAARHPWYRPLSEHPRWAAWGAILELAIRRGLAWHGGATTTWMQTTPHVEVAEDASPTVLFDASRRGARNEVPPVRRTLTIEVAPLRDRFSRFSPRRLLAAHAPVVWALQPETIPWWAQNDLRRPESTPDANQIWTCASFDWSRWSDATAAGMFGEILHGTEQQPA